MPAYAAALILLLLVQAGLGGVTVLDQNSPWSVALHLSAALLLFSVLWLIFARTGRVVAGPAGAAAAAQHRRVAAGARRHGERRHDDQERRRARLRHLAAVRWRADPGPGRSADPPQLQPSPARVRRRLRRARPLHRAAGADPSSGRWPR